MADLRRGGRAGRCLSPLPEPRGLSPDLALPRSALSDPPDGRCRVQPSGGSARRTCVRTAVSCATDRGTA
ncbi:hypothetical protein SSAG_04188 [Streptomyces sp. Mg1]|nr:hypothetical protein SSAG_04188 [Streptomyces sp. Mg1]